MPKYPDELSLKQAELVIVLQKEDGKVLLLHTASIYHPQPRGLRCSLFCQSGAMGRE